MCTGRGTQPSVDSLARYAFSAYTLGIKTLDEAALTGLLTCARDRFNAYARWDGRMEIRPPPVRPAHAILAARVLPEPASSILAVAFVDLSVFGHLDDDDDIDNKDEDKDDDASISTCSYPYPQIIDAAAAAAPKLRGRHDEDTIALLRERHAELVDALLRLSATFGRRRSLSKRGRPCCNNFGRFVADHTPEVHVNPAVMMKGRSALAIIATLGAELEKARLVQALAKEKDQAGRHPAGRDEEKTGCLKCLNELHQGMKMLYDQWWEDMGRLLMGEPQGKRTSAWDEVRRSLSAPRAPVSSAGWRDRLKCFLCGLYRGVVGLLFPR